MNTEEIHDKLRSRMAQVLHMYNLRRIDYHLQTKQSVKDGLNKIQLSKRTSEDLNTYMRICISF